MGFMFIWQFFVSGPAELASGYIAISEYLLYLFDTSEYVTRVAISLCVCLMTSLILFRTKDLIGSVALSLWAVTGFAMLFVLIVGFANWDTDNLESPSNAFSDSSKLIMGIAATTRFGVYDMTGYYDVCSFGDEVQNPRKNIPASCVITCMVVACIYIAVYVSVLGALNWETYIHQYTDDWDGGEPFGIISIFTENLVNKQFAYVMTIVVCITIFGSNFAQLCGYAYLPYAAAQDGYFFDIFKEKSPNGLPYYSLLTVCVISAIWCFFSLDVVIDAMTTLLVLVQFVGQAVGLMLYKHYHSEELPADRWSMPLYPLPCIVQIIIFCFIFITTDNWIVSGNTPILEGSIVVLFIGVLMFLLTQRVKGDWPFTSNEDEPNPMTKGKGESAISLALTAESYSSDEIQGAEIPVTIYTYLQPLN